MFLLSFPDHNVYAVPVAFSKLLSDRFQKPNQIAYVSVFILHAHIDNAAVVWDTVKFRVDLDPSLSEFLPDGNRT